MVKGTEKTIPSIGFHFGKTDLERYGYFAEMPYLHGAGYNKPVKGPDIRDPKLRQMYPGFPKWKTGLQDCYFDKIFKRIFSGEAYYDPVRNFLRMKMEEKKKNRGLFRPTSYTHLQSGRGDYYGCFTTHMKAFDPRISPQIYMDFDLQKGSFEKFNQFIPSSPAKKGGYGYLDFTINPYPKYIPSPYDLKLPTTKEDPNVKAMKWLPPSPPGLFTTHYTSDRVAYDKRVPAVWSLFGIFKPSNPTKTLGGCMDGCFDKWPNHSYDKYIDPWRLDIGMKKQIAKATDKEKDTKWYPNGGAKTNPTPSVMERKVNISTNANTWRTMRPVTYTREFL